MKTDAPASIVMQRELRHPPEKVWRALTETKLLDEWLLKNDFKPVVGHKFTFRRDPVGNWDGVVTCEVLAVEPARRLAYTWQPWGGASWVVTWTLEPTPSGTRIRMEHSGFTAGQESARGGAEYGWKQFLAGLERVLEEVTS